MDDLNKPIGIYGGTFDPIHFGHLRPVLEVAQQCQLEQIRFIPSHKPPHRNQPDTDSFWRVKLVKAAISDQNNFVLDQREVERDGPSYMIETLISLNKDFPQTPLCLILGLDAFLDLPQWHRWEELLNYCHIIITRRPGQKTDPRNWAKPLAEIYRQRLIEKTSRLHQNKCGKIIFIQVTQLDISASQIRALLKKGLSVNYLLPQSCLRLIQDNQLYL